MTSREVTGTIKGARWDSVFPIVWGFLHDDIRNRWPDGALIHTSQVTNAKRPEKPEYIETLHSYYRVEWEDDGGKEPIADAPKKRKRAKASGELSVPQSL